jgi:glucose/mannose transport system substrate-binding protein
MRWDDPKVKQAMNCFGKMQDYLNPDHSALTWDQAVAEVIAGKSAFNSMGDWVYGEFATAGQKPNVDFGWVCHPGTDGSFVTIADGFTLAQGAPHKAETEAWLKTIGSKAAQEALNLVLGAIPARTDCDMNRFPAYFQWSMQSFAKDVILPSCVHGEAAPAAFQQALNDAVTAFIVDKNVDNFANALVHDDVHNGGVLCALPALLAEGLLRHTRSFYRLRPGFYP